MTSDLQSTKTDNTETSRKPYTTPELVQYGNIRELTKATGGVVGKNDGGGGNDKTG
jgi:hypothetical protein